MKTIVLATLLISGLMLLGGLSLPVHSGSVDIVCGSNG